MASNRTVTILVVALVAAFFVLLMLPQQYVPYSKAQNYAKYEAFTEGADGAEVAEDNAAPVSPAASDDKLENEKKSEPKPTSIMDSVKNMVTGVKPEGFEPLLESPKTVDYGFLHDSGIIDKFSQVTQNGIDGQNGCVSSGLSNSGGYICLTPELIQMLKTRGGNATGGEAPK